LCTILLTIRSVIRFRPHVVARRIRPELSPS
jgi:hypothetical protein